MDNTTNNPDTAALANELSASAEYAAKNAAKAKLAVVVNHCNGKKVVATSVAVTALLAIKAIVDIF